ncbi:MAG: hypothetical protein Q9227_002935 [Pyrenula ochraceoflavens]
MASKLTISSTIPLPNSSILMPRLGFGVYQSTASQCVQSCLNALRAGYRHFDSAQFYRNEAQVGEAVKQSGISRSDIFITTKILASAGTVAENHKKCKHSVDAMAGSDGYVDLFLIHSPHGGQKARQDMWQALEQLKEEDKVKSIGVSNFGVSHIEEMKSYAKVWPPQVNQIELHPWCQQRQIVDYCHKHGIVVQAYCPLVRNQKAYDPMLMKISEAHGKTTAQVLIRYCLQKNWVPLPKSDNPERIVKNAEVYDFELSGEEMESLDNLDQGSRGAIVEAVVN